jgi:VWFA-related protein
MKLKRIVPIAALAALALAALPALPAAGQNGTTRERRVTPETSPAPSTATRQSTKPAPPAKNETLYDDGDEPIQLSTDVVNVLFSVTDRQNRFVPDLTENDIHISEGGVGQTIFSFKRETNMPLEVAILVDVSSSQEYTFADEKRAAQAFLQSVLRPRKDSAALVTFREDVFWVQGFTTRLERVTDAFNRLSWESRVSGGSRYGATALYDAIGLTATELFPQSEEPTSPEDMTRRAIVLLTDGADNASQRKLQEAIDDSLRSDVIVYTIGIGDRYRSTAVKRDVLELVAQQTGGRAYFPQSFDDLRSAFKQIDEELRSQYLLSYEPSNISRDGSFREISITVPGRQDVKIFHRKGYYAPRPGASGSSSSGAVTTP